MVFIVREATKLSRPETARKVIKAESFWTYKQTKEALADAERRSQEIVDAAENAFKKKQEEGYRKGKEAACLEQAGNMMEVVSRTVEYFSKVENQMVELVLDAMRRIVSEFNERERVVAVVRNSLAILRNQKHLVLRVNPAHVETVRTLLNGMTETYPNVAYIDIVDDATLPDDACVVESEIGMVEANMTEQIKLLRQTLKSVFGGHEVSDAFPEFGRDSV